MLGYVLIDFESYARAIITTQHLTLRFNIHVTCRSGVPNRLWINKSCSLSEYWSSYNTNQREMLVLSAFRFTEALFDSKYRKVMKGSNISHRNWRDQCTEYKAFSILSSDIRVVQWNLQYLIREWNRKILLMETVYTNVWKIIKMRLILYVLKVIMLRVFQHIVVNTYLKEVSKSCSHTWCHVLLTHCYFFLIWYFMLGTGLINRRFKVDPQN